MIVHHRQADQAADFSDSAARTQFSSRIRRNAYHASILRAPFLLALFPISLAVFFCSSLCVAQGAGSQSRHVLTNQQIVQGIDAAVSARENAIAGYTVNEHYTLYLGQGSTPQGEQSAAVSFTRGSGATITPGAASGNSLLLSMTAGQAMTTEANLSTPENREGVLMNSANYDMTPESGRVQVNGHECVVVDLQPRRSGPGLINGKVWVDDKNFNFVHLEGSPTEPPDFVSNVRFATNFGTVDGVNMQVHTEGHADVPLVGDVTLTEDSTGYSIRH
jgi:hypothetical protein